MSKEDKLLVVRRVADDFMGGIYEMPGGGVDAGETLYEGAARELLEETGLVATELVAVFEGFDYSTAKKLKVRQINFKITTTAHGVQLDKAEHDDYRWISEDEVSSLKTSDNQREAVLAAFSA